MMTRLRFTDGVEIETSGELRKLRLDDGFYIVGEGQLIPCDDEAEADALLAEMRERRQGPPGGKFFDDEPGGFLPTKLPPKGADEDPNT